MKLYNPINEYIKQKKINNLLQERENIYQNQNKYYYLNVVKNTYGVKKWNKK